MTCHGKARGYSWKSRSIILETLKVFSWSLKLQECVFCYWKSQEAERLKVDSSMVVIAEWHTTLGGCAIQSGGNCSHDLQAKSWCSKVKIPQDWVRPEANLRQGAWPCCYRDYADETRIYFFLALRGMSMINVLYEKTSSSSGCRFAKRLRTTHNNGCL